MGKVIAKIKLSNYLDMGRAKAGDIKPEEVRSITTEGLVDTGANYLCLPEEIVEELGLEIVKEVTCNYANGQKEKKKIADGVRITFLDHDRDATVMCVVENRGTRILIGQIPLEYTDLHVSCAKETLEVNPDSPDMPLVEIF
ncbi:MAG: aspartyl protease family protein [Spirochaetota bacterium]|nr:aspartyl protease family protein [Spirochaetota bacterium]